MKIKKSVFTVAFSILFTLACAAFAAYFADTSGEWYASLNLPAFMPPTLVFTIVWGVLYALLAASLTFYTTGEKVSRTDILLYAVNGLSGPLWTHVFFRQHNLLGSLLLLIGMFILAISLYKRTVEKNNTAARLLLPYIVWLAFALYLNYETAFLN